MKKNVKIVIDFTCQDDADPVSIADAILDLVRNEPELPNIGVWTTNGTEVVR